MSDVGTPLDLNLSEARRQCGQVAPASDDSTPDGIVLAPTFVDGHALEIKLNAPISVIITTAVAAAAVAPDDCGGNLCTDFDLARRADDGSAVRDNRHLVAVITAPHAHILLRNALA